MCASVIEKPSYFIEISPLLRTNHAGSRMMYLDSLETAMICFKFRKLSDFASYHRKLCLWGYELYGYPG